MSTRIKNILQKLGLIVLLIGAIFGTIQAPTAQAAEESYSISQLTNFTADCGSIWSTGNDGDSFMKYGIACILSTIAQILIIGLLYAVGAFFALLLTGFAYASMAMIKLGVVIITKIGAISVGFKMALGVTNLLFVIAIILIAFSTILRWHEYEAKKLLPRLIFAALLVNFSLLIAGVMLDASNVFTNYFTSHFDVNHIGKALDPQKQIFDAPPGEGDVVKDSAGNIIPNKRMYRLGGGEHSWEHFFVLFPRALFAMLITFFMMMAMVAVFIMALVRNIWVVVLLITMPLAWGSWVIPKLEGYWKKWWENFINWGVLYLPIVTFFLFLGYRTMDFKKAVIGDVIPNASQSSGIGSFLNSALSEAIGSLIVIGIILAGLKIAQSMGSTIAGAFASIAGKGGRRLAKSGLKLGISPATAITGGLWGAGKGIFYSKDKYNKDIQDRLAKGEEILTDKLNPPSRWKTGFKGLFSGIGAGIYPEGENLYGWATEKASRLTARMSFLPGMTEATQFLSKTSAAQYEEVNRAVKAAESFSPAALENFLAAPLKSAAEQVAAMILADKNHMHDAISDKSLRQFSDSVAAFNRGVKREKIDLLRAFADHNPFHSEDVTGEKTDDVFRRASREAAASWDMGHWTPTQISRALNVIPDSLKRVMAGKNAAAQAEILAHAVGGLSNSFDKFTAPDEVAMVADFKNIQTEEGKKNRVLIKRVEGHVEKLSDSGKKDLREKLDAASSSSLSLARDVARMTISAKSKSEHGVHGYPDHEVWTMLSGFFKPSGKSGGSSSSHAESSSTPAHH